VSEIKATNTAKDTDKKWMQSYPNTFELDFDKSIQISILICRAHLQKAHQKGNVHS